MAAVSRRGAGPARPLGRIERIWVENFKSYSGRHEIGPFDKFTCIIGPNGSGKSNIMDAISFCLGIRAKHLRGDRLKDLVYRREEEAAGSNARSAEVTLEFRTSEGELLLFGRHVNSRGEGSYRFGPEGRTRAVGHEEFIAQLATQQVLVKARNFLVFQGDVMELARRQGLDLTTTLETISGSDQVKERYERLSRELEVSQEKARMYFQHRRELESHVALLERQRAEVERYQALRARKAKLGVELVLFRLYVFVKEAERATGAGVDMRRQLASLEVEARARRRELDELEQNRKRLELEFEKATSSYYVLCSNLEQLKPEINNCVKQATHWVKKLQEREAQVAEEERKKEGLASSVEAARRERARVEREADALRAKQVASAVVLTPAQRTVYERAVAKTDAMNVRTRERLREAEEQVASLTRELVTYKQDLLELERRSARGADRLEEMARERAAAEAELGSDRGLLQQQQRKSSAAAEEVKKFMLFRDSLLEEQRSLRCSLDALRARRERLEQVEVRQRVADELRGAFPSGVIGRVSELVLPTQKRFELPLQMSLGGMAEAFVVADGETGRKCVRYLKEKQISVESFLPLDRMVAPNVGPLHLLTEGYRARRLATMCVQHNDKFLEHHAKWQADGPALIDQTVEFLLRGTIITDDLDEARTTAFQDARRRGLQPRVVTLDGEVIAANGNMSVQSVGSMGRVEFGGGEQLREMKSQEQKLEQVERDIDTLQQEMARRQERELAAREQSREVQERYRVCEAKLCALADQQANEQKGLEDQKARVEELKQRLAQRASRGEEIERRKDTLEAELLRVGRKYFEKLNQELGVGDIREIISKEQRERRRLKKEIDVLEDQARRLLNEERAAEQRSQVTSRLTALKNDCEQYRHDISAVQARQKGLEEREKLFEERCEIGKKRKNEATIAKERLEHEAKAKKLEEQHMRARQKEIKEKLKKHNEKVRVLLSMQCAIYRESEEKQIEVPFICKDGVAMDIVTSREQDLDDLPFEDLDGACRKLQVDFAGLPEDRKQVAETTNAWEMKPVAGEYDAEIAEINKELERLSPNMRAVDEHKAEEGKLHEVKRLAEETGTQSQRLAKEFESVKGERVSRFMKCFQHVESLVHPIYRELTSYDGFDGGSAYLDLDDAEEPYNGGITFTACPPGKRFFPMELLSGGERSMASMALLFAMHSFQPPPFMILDEVDAPFDRKNTNSLVSYLKKLDFQCLVISLKDTFFSHSDSIVGIFKDKEIQSSGSLSLPLRHLGEASEAPETERPRAEAAIAMDII